MRHGSLFSGIGGFDLAAEWMGWENVFHCEWNPFGQKVLKHYWPNATSYTDITKTDFTIHRGSIDILTGGFPCQPYSSAGLRKGKEDERHLWPEMRRAIREIQPTWVVGENVLGIVNWNDGLVFHEVQAELEAEGYEVQPFILPSAGVNGYDERYRVWFVAHSNKESRGLPILSKEHGIEALRGWETSFGSNDRFEPELASNSVATLTKWANRPATVEFYDGLPLGLDIDTFFKESNNAYGNAINPYVAAQIFKAIETYNTLPANY